MKKKLLVAILAGSVALTFMAATSASAAPLFGKPTTTPARAGTSTAAAQVIKGAVARCAIVESKIQVKVTNFDNAKIKHLSVYNNLKERLSKLADRLTARGADVTALRAAIATLENKIAKFNADYASYITKLKSTQESACGKSQGEFMAQLKEVRAALYWVHFDAADIRSYVGTTIKSEINQIRDSLKPSATSSTSTVKSIKATSTDKATKIKPIAPALPQLD